MDITIPQPLFNALLQRLGQDMREKESDLMQLRELMTQISQNARYVEPPPDAPAEAKDT